MSARYPAVRAERRASKQRTDEAIAYYAGLGAALEPKKSEPAVYDCTCREDDVLACYLDCSCSCHLPSGFDGMDDDGEMP